MIPGCKCNACQERKNQPAPPAREVAPLPECERCAGWEKIRTWVRCNADVYIYKPHILDFLDALQDGRWAAVEAKRDAQLERAPAGLDCDECGAHLVCSYDRKHKAVK